MFREVTPVGHSNLKTDLTDYRGRCWKTISRRVDPVMATSHSTIFDIPMRPLREDQKHRHRFTR